MSNLFSELKKNIKLLGEGIFPGIEDAIWRNVTVERPKDASHGDLSTNVAMILAKSLNMSPRVVADELLAGLKNLSNVAEVTIAGPGFINLRFVQRFWQQQLSAILSAGTSYGDADTGNGVRTNIEYVSANPTGPLHIGHARGAVVGDALALLLAKAGYDVVKEYYINDAGAQVDVLAKSAFLRYREVCGETIGEIPAGLYPGDYLVAVGEQLKAEHGTALLKLNDSDWLPKVRAFAIEAMLALIRTDLADLGVKHDIFSSERALNESGRIGEVIGRLEAAGAIYRGVLEPPKGKTPEDWEPREQTLFRSSAQGDDSDRPLVKSDGSYTYFAGDVAYTDDKLSRGFIRLILILGADHGGYVGRMKALVAMLGSGKASVEILLCQLVKLFENGEPFKMSKRAGTFVTVRDVLDAVGKDVLRFVMLTRKPEQPLDFDLAKVKEQSKDNPVFYVQYAHARCRSLLRLAGREMPQAVSASEQPTLEVLAKLAHPAELALIKRLAYWPQLVESAAVAGEPHRVAFYLHDVAADFHSLWNLGSDDTGLRFVIPGEETLSSARLALARGVATVIASGLAVLGVEPAEEMR